MRRTSSSFWLAGIFIILALAAAFVWRRAAEKPVEHASEVKRIKVVTTIFPLYLLAQGAGEQLIDVDHLIPLSAMPWDYELSDEEKSALQGADLLIRTGTAIDRWAEGLADEYPDARELVVGDSLRLLPALPLVAGGTPGAEDDPYFWLDTGRMLEAAGLTRDALIAEDPTKKMLYWAQTSAFLETLGMIDRDFRERFRGIHSKRIASSSGFLTYFVNSFGLEWVGAGSERPGRAPAEDQRAGLIRAMRSEEAPALFAAPQDDWASDFAAQAGVPVHTFDPLVFASGDGVDYDTVMRENMRVMSQALGYEAEME